MNSASSFTIGRSADNHVVIDKQGISRKHAKVTFITDNVVLLEDLESSYGTYVDGCRIARTIISPDSRIVLGQVASVETQRIFKLRQNRVESGGLPARTKQNELDFRTEFKRLENVQEIYTEAREAIQTKAPIKQAYVRGAIGLAPILGGVAIGLAGSGLGFIPIIAGAVGQILAAHFINIPEKLLALEKEFKRNYACPSCQQFLGNVPYRELTKRKKCRDCGAIWTD